MQARGLKRIITGWMDHLKVSRLMQARGLKRKKYNIKASELKGRASCRRVD